MELRIFEINGILENQLIGGMKKIIGVLHYKHFYQDNHLLIYRGEDYIMSVDIKLEDKPLPRINGELNRRQYKREEESDDISVSLMDMDGRVGYFENVIKPKYLKMENR